MQIGSYRAKAASYAVDRSPGHVHTHALHKCRRVCTYMHTSAEGHVHTHRTSSRGHVHMHNAVDTGHICAVQWTQARTYMLCRSYRARTDRTGHQYRAVQQQRVVGLQEFAVFFLFLFSVGSFPSLGALVSLESLFNEKLI
jgi:hypothetical protein